MRFPLVWMQFVTGHCRDAVWLRPYGGMCICGIMCPGVCVAHAIDSPQPSTNVLKRNCHRPVLTSSGIPRESISLLRNHPQPGTLFGVALYGNVAICGERWATAVCTWQFFGAVSKGHSCWRALAENPLGVGFPERRCWTAVDKLGGIRASIHSMPKETG